MSLTEQIIYLSFRFINHSLRYTFFLALRGSPFVFSLPCLLNRRKNNRWCWENVKEEESLFKMNPLFMWNVKKNSAERKFPFNRGTNTFLFFVEFCKTKKCWYWIYNKRKNLIFVTASLFCTQYHTHRVPSIIFSFIFLALWALPTFHGFNYIAWWWQSL